MRRIRLGFGKAQSRQSQDGVRDEDLSPKSTLFREDYTMGERTTMEMRFIQVLV